MPQQLEDMTNTLDESEQCIIIQATTADEVEEDDESSSSIFGKYDKYFNAGNENYEQLYRVAKLILPTALYATWKGFINFQIESNSPRITNNNVAAYTSKNVRTIELNLQRLRQAGLVKTRHMLQGENLVVEKNFSSFYQLVLEYMEWERSPAYMPPTREYFDVDWVDRDVCSKLLHFNNYRRILHNKKPGPKRKKIYPEEKTFIDGIFTELPDEQNPPSGVLPVEPMSVQLDSSASLPNHTSSQATPAAILPEKKHGQIENADTQVVEAGLPLVAVSTQAEVSNTEITVVLPEKKSVQTEGSDTQVVEPSIPMGTVSVPPEVSDSEVGGVGMQAVVIDAQSMGDASLSEVGSAQNEIVPLQPGAMQEQEVEQGQDAEEIKKRIMAEYQRIVKEEGKEEAMQWLSTQNLEWIQPQDWDTIFEQESACKQLEDGMKLNEENVVEQEPACEDEEEPFVDDVFDPIKDFDSLMDYLVNLRRKHMAMVGEWYRYLHELYDEYGRFIIDSNLIRFQARNQPKVPFARFLTTDQKYKCLRNPRDQNYSQAEFAEKLNGLLDSREDIYQSTENWGLINAWVAGHNSWEKVDSAYLERLSREEIKKLMMVVKEPEADPMKPLKDKFVAEQKRLREEKDKMQADDNMQQA